jgi:hypothetical protein
MTGHRRSLGMALAVLIAGAAVAGAQQRNAKPRIVITADPELDDNNTLVRAILYTMDFQVEGLVYTSGTFHWKGDGKGTTQNPPARQNSANNPCPCTSWRWPTEAPYTEFIDTIVDAYAKSYANLKVHDPNYPDPKVLKSKIKWGNVEFEGDYSKDTDGSNLIKSLLLDDKPGPLYVTAQGGQSSIVRALKSIYDQYSKTPNWLAIRNKVSQKLVIIPFGDQDSLYARYIRPNWSEVTEWQLAMISFGYGTRNGLAPENLVYIDPPWTAENILSRGPLGALYRVYGDGKKMDPTDNYGFRDTLPKGSFISEGDTPTFLNLLDNGLRSWENSGFAGGWGGIRRQPNAAAGGGGFGGRSSAPATPLSPDDPGIGPGVAPAGSDANKSAAANPPAEGGAAARGPGAAGGARAGAPGGGRGGTPIPPRLAAVNTRFFAAAQNDFAARLKWSVTPKFGDANHAPKVSIKGPLEISARPGGTVRLQGVVSDPDKNTVKVNWWQYNDAGTYPGDISLADPAAPATTFRVPDDAKPGQTIHLILEATDNGAPPLTRYQRVIVRLAQ